MALFGHSSFMDPDVEDWTFQTWAWLMRNQDGMRRIRWAHLVTPAPDAFPATDAIGHERAEHLLRCVVRAMDFSSIECDLEPLPELTSPGVTGMYGSSSDSRESEGGQHIRRGRLVIGYESQLVDDPMRLVAVLAHQLCRYEVGRIAEAAPGGAEAVELTADMAVAHRGLAIFGANAAFEFQARSARGWSASYCGFLSEETWALGLAIFLALKGDAGGEVNEWLEPTVRGLTHDAQHYLAKRPQLLEPLRAIQ